jgi:hypothetical protein
MKDIGVEERIILKCILNSTLAGGLDWSNPVEDKSKIHKQLTQLWFP